MTETMVDFTCRIDKQGYKVVPAKPPRQPGQTKEEWEEQLLKTPLDECDEERIVGLGGRRKALRLNQFPMLYGKFANIRARAELFEFIITYGPLTKRNEIPLLLDAAKKMSECLRKRKLPSYPIVNLRASFANAVIKYTPTTLLDALWLQLAQELAGGAKVRECDRCGSWFSIGGKSGKRLVARFCSDQCRIEFNSLKRSR